MEKKELISEIITRINNISSKRKEAENLIGNFFTKNKFELLCKTLSSDIYTVLFEYIEDLPKIMKELDKKIKLEFLSNQCCYNNESEQVKILHKKITSEFFLKVHANHFKYADYIHEMIASYKKLNLFFPSFISILPYEKRQIDYSFNSGCGIMEFGINSFSILQPLIITQELTGNLIQNIKYPDSKRKHLNKNEIIDMRQFYSKEVLNLFYKKSNYNIWLNSEVALNYSFCLPFNLNNEKDDTVTGFTEHLSRREIILVLRNKFGGVHRTEKSDSFDKQKIDLLFTLFSESKIMNSLYVSILSIAYEIEYSWENYISPLILNKII